MLDETKSIFVVTQEELERSQQRLEEKDCHLTCLMVGGGDNRATDEALCWEASELSSYQDWIDALTKERVSMSRRAMRVMPQDFSWELMGDALLLKFSLPTGAYATSVLREIVEYRLPD